MQPSEIMNHPVVIALRKQRNDASDIAALMAAENAALRSANAQLKADVERLSPDVDAKQAQAAEQGA
jgi:hypothetical protein